jgi:SPP1 family predicted phage head-tail adaptor
MNWRAGELDQLITIKREVLTPDGMGGQDVSLIDLAADIWAKVKPLSGNESQRFDKLNAEMSNTFVVRYRDDVREDDRILWHGDQYNIRSIAKAGSRELYTVMVAERGVAQ